jgi:hypothetical protein
VAQRVVHLLEAISVDQHQGQRRVAPGGTGDLVFPAGHEATTVGQAGQYVGVGQALHLQRVGGVAEGFIARLGQGLLRGRRARLGKGPVALAGDQVLERVRDQAHPFELPRTQFHRLVRCDAERPGGRSADADGHRMEGVDSQRRATDRILPVRARALRDRQLAAVNGKNNPLSASVSPRDADKGEIQCGDVAREVEQRPRGGVELAGDEGVQGIRYLDGIC